jgi:hypothetical protein
MKEFVGNIVQDLQDSSFVTDIDTGVYTSWRNFRMVANTKPGKANHLIAQNLKGTLQEQLLQCFVSVMRGKKSYAEVDPTLDALFNCKRIITRTETTDKVSLVRSTAVLGSCTIPDQYKELVSTVEQEEILKKFPSHSFYRTFQQFNGYDFIDYIFSPGLPCPRNGDKPHKSNKTYFKIDIGKGMVFYRCADPECSKDVFGAKTIQSVVSTQKAILNKATDQGKTVFCQPSLTRSTGRKKRRLNEG